MRFKLGVFVFLFDKWGVILYTNGPVGIEDFLMRDSIIIKKCIKYFLSRFGLEWKVKYIFFKLGFYEFPVTTIKAIAIDKHKAIYVPIPKVANSSIKSVCADLLELKIPDGYNKVTVFDGRPYPFLNKKEIQSDYKNYWKFAFVRNPWDRLVSCWAEKIHADPTLNNKFLVNGVGRGLARYECFYAGMSFEMFAKAVASIPEIFADPHFASQHTFLCDDRGELLVDYVGKFETLEQDFVFVREKLGSDKFKLPHLIRSSHKHYKKYYTEKVKLLVERRYAKDIQLFGYRF